MTSWTWVPGSGEPPCAAAGRLAGVASRDVKGVTLPLAVAGHPALELCNTRAGWGEEAPREYLTAYADLAVWARELGLLPAATTRRLLRAGEADPVAAFEVLDRTRVLRADLYVALTSPSTPPAALRRLSAAVAEAASTLRVRRGSDGLRLTREDESLAAPLRAVADATRRLVENGLTSDVGRCPGAGCGWLFLRNGRSRRWCIMAVCGNRAKARRHAERQRAAQSA